MTRPFAPLTGLALAAALAALPACESSAPPAAESRSTLDVRVEAPPTTTAAEGAPHRVAATAADREARPTSWNTAARVEDLDARPVAASPPPTQPPAQPAPRPAPSTPTQTDAPERWWLLTPEAVPGRIRIVAKARAGTIVEARQAAVDAGRAQLIELRGSTPPETEVEKVQALRQGDAFEAFVLISCDR